MNKEQTISYINNPGRDSKAYQACAESLRMMYAIYVRQEHKFRFYHHITRRLESLAGLLILFGVLVLAVHIPEWEKIEVLKHERAMWLDVVNSGFMALLAIQIFTKESLPEIKHKGIEWQELEQQVKESANVVEEITSLTTYVVFAWGMALLVGFILNDDPFFMVGIHSFVWGTMLFGGSYSANRKYGYTRAFMRNGFFAVRVEVLHHQLETDQECIDTVSSQLTELCIEAKAQAYQDTVSDYIEVNNSITKWLSAKKLK